MVNADVLKKHASQYKLTKETAGEYHKNLFKKHPDVAEAYGAEDIDPDVIGKAQKYIMYGMSEMQYFFRLPEAFGNEGKWRTALSSFKEHYSDITDGEGSKLLSKFNKVPDAFLAAMEKNAGGVTAEQKKNWEELLKKAYDDMKSWGWF